MESFKKSKKRKVNKMRFKAKTNGKPDMKHNHYTVSSTLI